MNTTTFFFLFIPLLAFILLAVNLIASPHNPYPEKNSVFECGYHSFLGQNRTQFSISFFIFALLFLLFDLEILLVYPYIVSGYTNSTYGLAIMLIFISVLTIGFVFELGKKALKIDTRQIFSLAKVQQTTQITTTSGFFSFLFSKKENKKKYSFAIFRGLFKMKHLKSALKKVFAFYTVFTMFVVFTVTTVVRILIIIYIPAYLFIESDLLFCISSISTIFTATSIRKYFQLFNPFFESIEWHSVYHFFTCSKTERSEVLQDFIKSLEEFSNEKVKVNNYKDSLKDNLSLNKKVDNINTTVSKMDGDPSKSLTRGSGSGNKNATSSGATGSGNNNASGSGAGNFINNNNSVARPRHNLPANNNNAVAGPSGSNNLSLLRLTILDRQRDVMAAKLAANAINDSIVTSYSVEEGNVIVKDIFPGPSIAYPERKLKYLNVLSGAFQDETRNPFQIFSRSPSPFSGSISSITTNPDVITGWIPDPNCSSNWNTALTKLYKINTYIFLQVYQSGTINREIEALKRVIDNMFGEIGTASHQQLESQVGYTLTEKTMREVFTRYPIYQLNGGLVPHEPDLYTFTLHTYNSLKSIYDELYARANIFESYHHILFRTGPYKISQYRERYPEYYNIVATLVDEYGTEELKMQFAKQGDRINPILISLSNHSHDLFMAGSQYGRMLEGFIIKSRAVFVNDDLFKRSAEINRDMYSTAQVSLGKVWFSNIDKWLE